MTLNGVLRGGGAGGAPVALAAATDGQLVIGSTSAAPVVAALTGTAGRLTVTNGAGSITLDVGADVYRSGGTDVALADGGTGASLTDPNADRLVFWDDSAGAVAFLTAGSGLTISGTTITASGGVTGTGLTSIELVSRETLQAVSNSTTLVNDTVLVVALAASEIASFLAVIHYSSSAAADYKCTFTVPAGATIRWNLAGGLILSTGDAVNVQDTVNDSGTTIAVGGSTADARTLTIVGRVRNGATAGNLQFQFAQNTADPPFDAITRPDSYMIVWTE